MKKQRKPLLAELTIEEKDVILPVLIKLFRTKTNDMVHLTSDRIVDWFVYKKDVIGYKKNFTKQRFMKLTNYIRVNGMLPLISTNDGYFITREIDTIRDMIESFRARIASQEAAVKGLEYQLKEIEMEDGLELFDML